MFVSILLFALLLQSIDCFSIYPYSTGCTITVDGNNFDPIIVASNSLQPLNPETPNLDISITQGSTILVGCPGGELSYDNLTGTVIEATCISGTTFSVNGENVSLKSVYCSKNPTNSARYTNKTCELNGLEIEIGFALDDDTFARLMRICFDDNLKSTLYSHYSLTSKIANYQVNVPRPSFVEDKFYNLDKKVNDLYSRTTQKATINGQIGLEVDSTKYISDTTDYYLARGHFTAKTDFVFASQQRATFYYVNAAPQWQTVNAANWKSIEDSARGYSSEHGLNLQVYTGGYGLATLPHEVTGKPVQLYLYVDENNNEALPVPELFWKLVYNSDNGNNIVIISHNNPYEEEVDPICADVSDEVSWITWKKTDIKAGYSYACNAKSLAGIIPQMPKLKFTDLLS